MFVISLNNLSRAVETLSNNFQIIERNWKYIKLYCSSNIAIILKYVIAPVWYIRWPVVQIMHRGYLQQTGYLNIIFTWKCSDAESSLGMKFPARSLKLTHQRGISVWSGRILSAADHTQYILVHEATIRVTVHFVTSSTLRHTSVRQHDLRSRRPILRATESRLCFHQRRDPPHTVQNALTLRPRFPCCSGEQLILSWPAVRVGSQSEAAACACSRLREVWRHTSGVAS